MGRLALLLIVLLLGCQRETYYTYTEDEGEISEDMAEAVREAARWERYERRGQYLQDIGRFGPETGESYERYRDRLLNTMKIQEYQLESLQEQIEKKEQSVLNLKSQLANAETENAELRVALTAPTPEGVEVSPLQRKKAVLEPFSYYTVRPGDTLQKIAFNRYGTHTAWLGVYRFNQKKLSHGPNRIYPGDILLLPNLNTLLSFDPG